MSSNKEVPQPKNLTVAGQEITVLVSPKKILTSNGEGVSYKPRITSSHSLQTVEELVGRDKMRYQDAATYSRHNSEEEAVLAILEGKGDVALVSRLPEMGVNEESNLSVLATIDLTGSLQTE